VDRRAALARARCAGLDHAEACAVAVVARTAKQQGPGASALAAADLADLATPVRIGTVALAGGAAHQARHGDRPLDAGGDLFERERDRVAQVVAALGLAASEQVAPDGRGEVVDLLGPRGAPV